MEISADSQAILLLCSYLGLPPNPDPGPLTLREWNSLAGKLNACTMRPGDLLSLSSMQITNQLDVPVKNAERYAYLLERGGALAIEIERLASLGIWVWTRADEIYPQKYRQRLNKSAPSLIFGAGDKNLPGQRGLAVVGSRNVDEAGKVIAEFIGNICSHQGWVLYSGGARGVDIFSMKAALEGRGTSVGVLAHSLEKSIRDPGYRAALTRDDLTLITPYTPGAGFNVGAAMGRNKLIYTLADYTLVIASEANKGGTWAGAVEALRRRWTPVFVVDDTDAPEGNKILIEKGGIPYPVSQLDTVEKSMRWIQEKAEDFKQLPRQLQLI